jgi:tungstate transport system substrate-binding protein
LLRGLNRLDVRVVERFGRRAHVLAFFSFCMWPALLGAALCGAAPRQLRAQAPADAEIVLATTTSVRDAGLLEVILPRFEHRSGYRVKVIAVGSGQAMELGRRGEADILMLHAPEEEARVVADGYGTERRPLMHNQFVLLGPPRDPAGVRGDAALDALRDVSRSGALFVSRADRSGTHAKELELWLLAGVEPERSWYRESGQGMSATLQIANELGAYTLCDVGTMLAHEYPLDLDVLVEGDTLLFNPYHVVLANPTRFEWINADGARALRDHLLSRDTQREIGAFGVSEFGRPLFVPDGVP